MTSPLLRPDGRPWTAQDVNNLHKFADTDRDATALHHTLGTKKNQAAPGDHGHNGIGGRLVSPVYIRDPTGGSAGIELGDVDHSSTPYIDFHSSGSGTDFDSRLIGQGDRASNTDILQMEAYNPVLGTFNRGGGTTLNPCDGTDEGGQLNLKGAGAYGDVTVDNYQGNLRLGNFGVSPVYVRGTDNELFSTRNKRFTDVVGGTGPNIQGGTGTVAFSASTSGTTAITFPAALIATPVAWAAIVSGSGSAVRATIFIVSISSSGMTVRIDLAAAATVSIGFHWMAIGTV